MSLRDSIKKIAGSEFAEIYGVPCKVSGVDLTAKTCVCSPVNGDADFIDVRLQAESGNGILIIPTVGSVVLIQPINPMTGYITMFSQVESIMWLDGSFGGLIKIVDLVNKLNNLENKVNDILNAFNLHTHGGVTSGSGSTSPPTSPITGTLTPTVRNDIENTDITHGQP